LVDGFNEGAPVAGDQALFKSKCKVDKPPPDDNNDNTDSGIIPFGLNSLLLLLSLAMANFYFMV
jgi:hypothetical protein